MPSLLIETSTEKGIAAFFSSEKLLFQAEMTTGFQQSRTLMAEIERGLKALDIEINDLTFIAIGVGPGSYTGMRVGAMGAKTFSWACKIPLVPLYSLEGLAPDQDGLFAAALDARISGAYVLFGEKKGAHVAYRGVPEAISLEHLAERLDEGVQIVTPHAKTLEKRWSEKNLSKVQFLEKHLDPKLLIERAYRRFTEGVTADDRTLQLHYLREWGSL